MWKEKSSNRFKYLQNSLLIRLTKMDFHWLYTSKDRRTQLIKKNVLVGFGVRGINILSSLLLVPLTIDYISNELYGIWLTLSSIIHWIGFFDIGFGNGLRNKLAESIAVGDYIRGRTYVSTTYVILMLIFIAIGIISYWGAEYINWSAFLKVSDEYNPILVIVSQILLISFSLQMILKLIQNILQAYQLISIASFLDTLGNIFSLIFIYILTLTVAPNLPLIAIAFSFTPLFVLMGASMFFFRGKFKNISPCSDFVKLNCIKELFQLGGGFFIIQIATVVLYQMINILISRMCGPEQVTNYNISYKYLSILLMIMTVIVSPMWSAFTDAYTKGEYSWMKKIYKKLLIMSGISAFSMACMIIVSPIVYDFWIGNNVYISLTTTFLVAFYVLILIWGMIHSFLLNGMSKIYVQLCYSVITMVLFIPLATFLGTEYGLNGILLSMILINTPGSFLSFYQVKILLSKKAKGIWNK